MQDAAVSIRSIRTKAHQISKAKSSAEHSLGLREENANTINKNKNKIFVLDVERENNEETAQIVKDYINDLVTPNTKYNDDDINNKSKQKTKILKWLENPKTNEEEKIFFSSIVNNLVENTLISDEIISDFEKIESKILRRNDKLKSLKSLQKTHNKILKSAKRVKNSEVVTVEKIFKLTSRTDCEMDAQHNVEMMKEFHQRFFPDYKIIFTAAHYDEVKDHGHLMHSGKNSKSGEFNYPDAELALVKKWMKSRNIECPYQEKTWYQMNKDDLKIHGENWQAMQIEWGNSWLKRNNYNDFQFKKLDEDESLKMKEKFSKDPDVKKKITDRNYNTSKYFEAKNKELEEEEKKKIENILKLNKIIKKKHLEARKLKEENSEASRFFKNMKKMLSYFIAFEIKNEKTSAEIEVKQIVKCIEELKDKQTKEIAIEICKETDKNLNSNYFKYK